jgi:hypothetical protein
VLGHEVEVVVAMVIPIGPTAFSTLSGPPPPQLSYKFFQIKVCVLAMVVFLLGKVLAAGMLGASQALHVLVNSLYVVWELLFGVWLLKDDPTLGQVYLFLTTTCCQMCADWCPGGMSCLMLFTIGNIINVAFAILIDAVLRQIQLKCKEVSEESPVFANTVLTVFIVCLVGSCIAQVFGAVFGWQAYKQALHLMATGEWQPEDAGEWEDVGRNTGSMFDPRGRRSSGSLFRAGGRPSAAGPSQIEMRENPSRQATSGFVAFSGSGQRLGDG